MSFLCVPLLPQDACLLTFLDNGHCCTQPALVGYNDAQGFTPFIFWCTTCHKVIINDKAELCQNTGLFHVSDDPHCPPWFDGLLGFSIPPSPGQPSVEVRPSTLASLISLPTYITRTLAQGWKWVGYAVLPLGYWNYSRLPGPVSQFWEEHWPLVIGQSIPDAIFNHTRWVSRWPKDDPDTWQKHFDAEMAADYDSFSDSDD